MWEVGWAGQLPGLGAVAETADLAGEEWAVVCRRLDPLRVKLMTGDGHTATDAKMATSMEGMIWCD